MRAFSVWLACSFILLQACGPVVKNPTPALSSLPQAAIRPSPPSAGKSQSPQEYRLQPGDQLDIKFFYTPELNEQVTVRPDGRISLQLIESLTVAGMTTAELTEFLKKSYSKELESPEITIFVRSFSAQKVYVAGEVNTPGAVNMVGPMTILQSISMVGGYKESAYLEEVTVIRRGADNASTSFKVDLKKAVDGSDLSQDVVLQPNDIVQVPRIGMVFVDGEVNKPGVIKLIEPTTIMQSVSQVGGLKDTARLNEVIIIRRGPDGKIQNLTVNLKKVVDGTDPQQDIVLRPYDIVFVPKSAIANVNTWVSQYIRLNIPLSFGLSYTIP